MLGSDEWLVIRFITLVAAVAALAYVLNLNTTQRLQRKLGITQLAVAGLPLVALGMLTRAPQIGVLSDRLLTDLSPIIGIALAGIGIRIGLRMDIAHTIGTPRGVAVISVVRLVLPWSAMFIATAVALHLVHPLGLHQLRDAALLATAATVASAGAARALSGVLVTEDIAITERAAQLINFACILFFLGVGAYARPGAAREALAPEVWLLNAIGLSVVLGICAAFLFRDRAASGNDAPVIAIGAVAIVAGTAMFLGFSPLPIGLLVGITVGVMAGDRRVELEAAFDRYQRLIYGMLLFLLGAVAIPLDLTAAIVALVLVCVRIAAFVACTRPALRIAKVQVAPATARQLQAAPLGATSVALILSGHLLYPGTAQIGAVAIVLATLVSETMLHARERGETT